VLVAMEPDPIRSTVIRTIVDRQGNSVDRIEDDAEVLRIIVDMRTIPSKVTRIDVDRRDIRVDFRRSEGAVTSRRSPERLHDVLHLRGKVPVTTDRGRA
jgi:hypothetical protein